MHRACVLPFWQIHMSDAACRVLAGERPGPFDHRTSVRWLRVLRTLLPGSICRTGIHGRNIFLRAEINPDKSICRAGIIVSSVLSRAE